MEYDPAQTNYASLLDIFWKNHDPTASHKRQYMSAIFYHDDDQKKLAEQTMKKEQNSHKRRIVTQILPAETFYNAEGYHQKYLLRNQRTLCKSLGLNDEGLLQSHVATRLNGYVGGYGTLSELETEIHSWKLSEEQANIVREIVVRDEGSGVACGR